LGARVSVVKGLNASSIPCGKNCGGPGLAASRRASTLKSGLSPFEKSSQEENKNVSLGFLSYEDQDRFIPIFGKIRKLEFSDQRMRLQD